MHVCSCRSCVPIHCVQSEGATALAQAIPYARGLRRLDLVNCKIPDGGLVAISQSLRLPHCHLLQVHVHGAENPASQNGERALIHAAQVSQRVDWA